MTSAQKKREEPSSVKRPSKHAIIMRGVVAPILGLLAIASIVLGYMNATVWKPSSEITAKTTISHARYLVTDPGVLQLIDTQSHLKVDAKGPDTTVCVALGSAKDVAGWVAGNAYTRVSGLDNWTTLATQQAKVQGTQSAGGNGDEVAFQDSDMWSAARCGNSNVTLDIGKKDANSIALIDLGESSPEATLSLHWIRHTLPDFAMPLYFVGGLLLVMMVLTASIFAMPPRKRRKRMVVSEPIRAHEEVAISEALTGSLRGLTTAVRIKPSGVKRRRHAAHRAGAGTQEAGSKAAQNTQATTRTDAQGPTIIDPTSRNMVADEQGSASSASSASVAVGGEAFADSGEETSVITPDELQAYFARLSQEISLPDQSQGIAGADDATAIDLDAVEEAASAHERGEHDDRSAVDIANAQNGGTDDNGGIANADDGDAGDFAQEGDDSEEPSADGAEGTEEAGSGSANESHEPGEDDESDEDNEEIDEKGERS
ncbi:MAG: hypothetical protein LKG16_04135 [Bifidobacterium subtile]|jgi:hypothetical protein|nr:hypothetical protein [Bifidobacterium subtile]MCI1241604.1 hypothetical protein [Bifidobacterium subtile]MCI1258402.1 hypothetical protein [Bifidobacterium subtile]